MERLCKPQPLLTWCLLCVALAWGTAAQGADMPKRWLPVDGHGWSVVQPSPETRIVYVSSSAGSDDSGRVYSSDAPQVGHNPTGPVGNVRPFASIDAAMEQARDGHPDWVLLRRGDQWHDVRLSVPSGRSAGAPFVLGAYGDTGEYPVLRGRHCRITIGSPRGGDRHVVVRDLEVYWSAIDPGSPDYVLDQMSPTTDDRDVGHAGLSLMCGKQSALENVLMEGCRLRFCGMSFTNFDSFMTNIVFRRNVVLDKYPVRGHTMGLWGSHGSVLVEENIFDHNGYLHPRRPETQGKRGLANPLSHNTYYSACYNTIYRDNAFLRGASMNNKWRADETGASHDIVIDNNLYVDGEIGIGIGGNRQQPLRFRDVTITGNVMLDIGRSRPTGRNLGWYLDIQDWDGGLVAGNLFAHQRSEDVRNVYAIRLAASGSGGQQPFVRNVTVRDNVIHGLRSKRPVLEITGVSMMRNVRIENNHVQMPDLSTPCASLNGDPGNVAQVGNTYFCGLPQAEWFRVDGEACGPSEWARRTGAHSTCGVRLEFPDPERDVQGYMKSLGLEPTYEAFIKEMRRQGRHNWRPEFTAPLINDWMRAGFGMKRLD